jgi:2-dehydro-3-deoxyphosphooctonate aldolase (KDO 8-P synthase)
VAAGVDAIFFEVHPDPDKALCDGPNSLALKDVPGILKVLAAIRTAVKEA